MIKLTGPSINRHRSKQDYETPREFIHLIEVRFGKIFLDLAADHLNSKGEHFLGGAVDSLKQDWLEISKGELCWLNPPFGTIRPWARKCAKEAEQGAKILLLVPASVDSNWWTDFVHHKAAVLFLSPRISFDGKNPYPKPCALCCYGFGMLTANPPVVYEPWRWK